MIRKPLLVVDVSPLWELQFTGISNVVYELAIRFLGEHPSFNIVFSVFHRTVQTEIIEECLRQRSGMPLRELFKSIDSLAMAASVAKKYGGRTFGLYLHIKPEDKAFDVEAQLYYDFSFLSVPECHHADTIDYHVRDLNGQVQRNDVIFTISESTAKDLSFYFGFPEERIEVALLGYHLDTGSESRFLFAMAGRDVEPYFICLGSIEPRKNTRLVLAWLAENPWALDAARFLFVGRDAWGDSFGELIQQARLEHAVQTGRILHVGYVSEAQKTALMMGAKGLLFPSLFEGFGLPVLEAMALGVPVAASCSSSIPEVLGPDGIYFDPYSIESFNQAMHVLLEEDESGTRDRCRRLQQRASKFSYDHCYNTIVQRLIKHVPTKRRSKSDTDDPTRGNAITNRTKNIGTS